MFRNSALLSAAVLALFLAACVISHEARGPVEHVNKTIDRGKAEVVNATLRFGAGELKVTGGTPKLLDADFATNVPSWQPDVRYEENGFRGRLDIHQPTVAKIGGNPENRWDLRFNNDTPLDLQVHMGAGESRLDLSTLTLRGLDVELGAGRIDLNLDGEYKKNFEVRVRGGVGEATIHLPRKIGVIAEAKGGIGHINVRGMRRDGDRWVNDAYEKSKVTVTVDVRGGVGQINLIAE